MAVTVGRGQPHDVVRHADKVAGVAEPGVISRAPDGFHPAQALAQHLLRTLGPLVLLDAAGVAISATRRKELALLAYLARREGRTVRRPELLDLLWGDRPEENARLSLRQALLRLRRLVGDALEVSPEAVTLRGGAIALDLAALERDVAERRYADAVERWEGDFLAAAEDAGGESYRAWVHGERAALRKLLVVAFQQLIAEASARGSWADVVALADRWSAADPEDERAHVALVDALLLRGRATDALARHAAFIAKLETAASREITRLGERLERAARSTAAPASPGSAGIFSTDLVGREQPHAGIVAAWRRARAGEATTVVVEGETGIGKTRLVHEFLRGLHAERGTQVLLRARGHGREALAHSVARELLAPLERAPGLAGASPQRLAALAQLVPAIHRRFPALPEFAQHPVTADDVASVVADVAAETPVVILIDDVAAADAASRDLLLGVASRLRDAAVLCIITARPGELASDELRDASVRTLRLTPLGADDLDALVASMMQMDDGERRALAARLHRERGGNPFDVIETVVMLVDDGLLAPDGAGIWRLSPALADRPLPVPGTVRDAMQRRVARLSPAVRRVLAAAASLDDGFTIAQLERAACEPSPVVADALDQLVARRLIRRGDATGRFEVAHHAVHLAAVASPPATTARRAVRRYGWLGAAAAALLAVMLFTSRQRPVFARSETPLVVVAGAWETSGDSSQAWLADGLPRLIESRLSRSAEVEVLPSARVDAVRRRAQLADNAPVAVKAAVDLGHRLGATWVVRAAVSQADSGVRVDLSVHEAASGALVRQAEVRGRDLFAAADAAVAQILSLAGVGRNGPRLAELETSSTAAFEQYIRAARASADGRSVTEIAALDAAIALDSSFGSALLLRAGIAREHGDTALLRRLTARLTHVRGRLAERDRLHWDASQALHTGDRAQAERLARELLARFPRDPRGHDMLADLYFVTGRWREMERLLLETLALDSLGMSAGDGPCVPCVTYGRLVEVQWQLGDREAAERSARRWVEVQPASANAHHHLAKVLARLRRNAGAEREMRRAVSLAGGDAGQQVGLARLYLMTGNLAAVDSLLRQWDADTSSAYYSARPDIRSLLALERGNLRPGMDAMRRALAADPRMRWLELVLATYHARAGDYATATALFEEHGHLTPGPVTLPLDATTARNFAWSHALLADAIAPTGDTLRLRAIADSIALVAPSSYFSRDWTLHHHVRGLIAMHGRRYAEAEREFQRARWGTTGWTRTVVELAKAQLAQGRAHDAMRTLRDAYEWPDAMGRYQPMRETDSLMTVARRMANAP